MYIKKKMGAACARFIILAYPVSVAAVAEAFPDLLVLDVALVYPQKNIAFITPTSFHAI